MTKLKLSWLAEYATGEVIPQDTINYRNLNRNLLKSLKIVNSVGVVKAEVTATDGEALFYRLRTSMSWTSSMIRRLHILGWRKRVGDRVEIHMIGLTDDGEPIVCERAPAPFPEEQV